MEKKKTATQIIEEVKEEICDNFCKYRETCVLLMEEDRLDELNCPLDKL